MGRMCPHPRIVWPAPAKAVIEARARTERERRTRRSSSARGEGREDGPQAGRPSTRAAGGRARAEGPGQSDRRGLAHRRWPAAASNTWPNWWRPTACWWSRFQATTSQIAPALPASRPCWRSGYFSEANRAEAEIAPLITPGRERHHLSWKAENPTPLEAMTIDWRRPRAGNSTPCASKRRNRCSASSNRPWASASSRYAAWTRSRANAW